MAGKYYTETIKKGSQGENVKEWQKYLNTQGYNLAEDGDFGALTEQASREWQKNNGLVEDGVIGDISWGKAGYTNPNKKTDYLANYNAASDALQNFQFSKATELNDIKNQIDTFQPFNYDVNADALYQQYVDQYMKQGNRASEDIMGQASALTGGYGNSYAEIAGASAYESYLDKLNDVVPELEQLAYERYNDKKDDLYSRYSLLQNESDKEYDQALNAYTTAKNDYEFNIWKAENEEKYKPIIQDTKEDYIDWDALDWESYFANIRSSEGKAAAESELNRMVSAGFIPKNLIAAAASGARGGKLGH